MANYGEFDINKNAILNSEKISDLRLFDNLPSIIRPEKIAPILGLSVKTIYDWRYRGKKRNVPDGLFLKFNRCLYIRTDILQNWITSQNPYPSARKKESECMSVYKVKTKSGNIKWEVRCYLEGRNSKKVRRRFEKKSDADQYLQSRIVEKNDIQKTGFDVKSFEETTFNAEATFWLQHQGKKFSPGHFKRVEAILKKSINPLYGNWIPNRFHSGFISQFQTKRLATGLSSATVNRETEVIKAVLSFATRSKRIPMNPCYGSEKLKETQEKMSFWEARDAAKFLSFTDKKYPKFSPDRWVHVVYLIALNTALRAGEIWGLIATDLNESGELFEIERQFDRVAKEFRPPKSKKARLVPCNSELFMEIQNLQVINAKTLFSKNDRPICHETFVRSYFLKDVFTSGVKKIRFHDLRHTAATLMIASGIDINTVKEICGHRSISTTMIYIHLLSDSVRRVGQTFSVSSNGVTSQGFSDQKFAPLRLVSDSGRPSSKFLMSFSSFCGEALPIFSRT